MANVSGHPLFFTDVESLTANRTVAAYESGKVFVSGAADVVVTLPDTTAAMKGMILGFVTSTLSTVTGFSISPGANDKIIGKGITTPADNKDMINTAATDAVGDAVILVCDGSDWVAVSVTGTWAREA